MLYVPIHAVVPEGDKHLVFLTHGDAVEERTVKIGKNNAHHVQVLEGLAEGDEILLYDPRAEGESSAAEGKSESKGKPEESALPGPVAQQP